ncbi:MAG TPA: Ig-like domain-containing protein, partial [Verrucomicrobiae bacterium]
LSSGSVVWGGLGNLAGGASTNLTLTVTAPLKGNISNFASTTSGTSDPTLGNNSTPPVNTSVTNLPPNAVNDSASTPKNLAVTIPVLANDSDANDDPLTLVAVTQTNGTASVSGTNVVFTPTTNFLGTVVLTYTVIDGQGGTNTALITISVTNRPPVALNDSTFGTNGIAQVISPLVNDSDPDGDSIIITNATASSGILVINPGNTNLTFTPTNNNTVVITYTIADGFGGTATATITVIGTNTDPVANNDSTNTPVNVPVLVSPLANDTDVDNNPLTIIAVSATNGTAIIVNLTNVLFTPDTNFDGTATVSYTIDDGSGGHATGLITITVTPISDLAIGKSAPATVAAAANFDYTITVTNLGPSAAASLSVTDDLPASVVFVNASPAATVNGSQVVWSLANLATNATTNLTLTVTAPANGASLSNTASVGSPTSDPNSTNNTTPPVLTSVTPVADLVLTKTGPAAAVLPGANFDYTLTVANSGPSAASNLSVTDSLPANVTFVSASAGGVFSSGNVIWASLGSLAAGGSTNLTLTVTAPLRGGITNAASVGGPTSDPNPTNNVTPPVTTTVSNLPPLAVNDSASTAKNVGVSVPALANDSDPNGDTLSITLVNPTNGTASINGANVDFTPTTGFLGTATCGYTISDGTATASALITMTVTNRAPLANGQNVSTPEDTALPVTLTGSDADTDPLTFILVNSPAHGAISGFNTNTGALTYT